MLQSRTKLLLAATLLLGVVSVAVLCLAKKEKITPTDPTPVVTPEPETPRTSEYPQHIESIPGTDEVWYKIPELGIQMRLNKEFAEDLIYKQDNPSGVVLSTKALLVVDLECSPEKGNPLGYLFKAEGVATEKAKKDEYLAARVGDYIQIGNHYYGWAGPQAVCSELVEKVFPGKYDGIGAKYVSDGVKTIELIPEKKE